MSIVLALAVVFLVLLIVNYVPIQPPTLKIIIQAVIAIVGLLWAFGVLGHPLNVK